MSRFKHSINFKHTEPWVGRVGKIVLNFSAIELESILWLTLLAEREFEIKATMDLRLTPRVTQIMRYVDNRTIGTQWRKKSLRAWNEALKLGHLRNQVAHNPITFGWSKKPEVGEPDILGIPNMRARNSDAQWLISTIDADRSINEMVAIAVNLAALRIEWCAARDKGEAPPLKTPPCLWYKIRRQVGIKIYSLRRPVTPNPFT